MKTIVDALLANGYTCKGSSNGSTAGMDANNRWATDANASVQGANTTTAVSWMVLVDGNGCNICLSYVGATGDVMRIAFSPGGLYVAAGTATHTPTATDECVLFSGVSLISTSLVNDRIVHVWIDSEAKMFRTCVQAAGAPLNGTWGVELVNGSRVSISYSPQVWGFAFTASNLPLSLSQFFGGYASNSIGGQTRINGTTCNVTCGVEVYANGNPILFSGTIKPELQKSTGFAMFPILIGTTTTNRQGPIGNLIDWWTGRGSNALVGDVAFPNGHWVQLGSGSSPMWPWDGLTPMQTA